MRRKDPTRHSRTTWRVRAVHLALALAGTAAMTAIAAAEIGGGARLTGDGGMSKAIMAQRIAEAHPTVPTQPAQPTATTHALPNAPDAESTPREKILAEAATIEAEMNQSLEHADQLRLEAYRAKDIIRTNFIANKLSEMKEVMKIAAPAFIVIRQPGQDLFVMRAKLSIIRQGWDRMKEAMAAAEASQGDAPDPTSSFGAANAEGNSNQGQTDPTLPPAPNTDIAGVFERPSQASPYQ